jgi:hypothetical protein
VKSSHPSDSSLMPPGLINGLNEDELRDLVAFILSGGDPYNRMFTQPQSEASRSAADASKR